MAEKKEDFLVLLCGRSGAGKTTIADKLGELYGWRSVCSYTDRAMRFPDEKGHVFVTPERFDMIPRSEMVAYTEFNGKRYCATKGQIANCEVYVIDPAGIREFHERYDGDKEIITVVLNIDRALAEQRMLRRGDSKEKVASRLENDDEAFRDAESLADLAIFMAERLTPETVAREIRDYVTERVSQ